MRTQRHGTVLPSPGARAAEPGGPGPRCGQRHCPARPVPQVPAAPADEIDYLRAIEQIPGYAQNQVLSTLSRRRAAARGRQMSDAVLPPLALLESKGEKVEKPLVVRLDGNNAELGRKILSDANHPLVQRVDTMDGAADKAAELAAAAK
ncbi:hypothetical protein SFIMM107S_00327 [Streptomyces griseus]